MSGVDGPLHTFWNLYRETLFADISAMDFADVYAQTFTYGLFLAWLNVGEAPSPVMSLCVLSRTRFRLSRCLWILRAGDAYRKVLRGWWMGYVAICSPPTVPLCCAATQVRKTRLFTSTSRFSLTTMPSGGSGPGVYYTPDAVVDFLVRAVDDVLRAEFGRLDGLASEDVTLLDPATGTATFLARAYRQVQQTVLQSERPNGIREIAENHLMKHFYGFERLPAAYTLAHVKLRELLREMGVIKDARLPLYMVDTLTNTVPEQSQLPGPDILTREVREAMEIRNRDDVLVVLGNPPYFGRSSNPSRDAKGNLTFIGKLLESYFCAGRAKVGRAQSPVATERLR